MIDLDKYKSRELDKLLAEKFDVTDRTIRNYKKHLESGSIMPTGKGHLYKAMLLYMYFTEYGQYKEEGEIVSEHFNRVELLQQSIDSLENNLNLDTSDFNKEIKEAVNNSIKRDINNIKEIANGIK